jgi:alpha-beta hydrolase superfamily lysophospholipase
LSAGRPAWLRRALTALACTLIAALLLLVALGSSGARPGPFYAVPRPLPKGPPGTLIRAQLIPDFYAGTTTYRILYKSTGLNGRPTAVSGLVIIPEGSPPARGRRVIAFAHGSVGIESRCAPSLQREGHPQTIAGLGEFIADGYVIAASDYQGLGTAGPHPYLIGRVAAMNVIDSVRAARRLPQAHAGRQFAVWGVSEGGQAALFAGQIARSYAPRLHLKGVVAGAPIANLVGFFNSNLANPAGRVLLSMALRSWEQVYREAGMEQLVSTDELSDVQALAGYCLYGAHFAEEVPASLSLGVSFIGAPPWGAQPWRSILAQNTPGAAPIYVPVLLIQGEADRVLAPSLTEGLAHQLCERGEHVDLRLYPAVEDQEVGIVAAPDVVAWIAGRFTGELAPDSCA